jgi:hypothetical protein
MKTYFKILLVLLIGLFLGYFAFATGVIILKAFIGLAIVMIFAFGFIIGYQIGKWNGSRNQQKIA